MKCRYCKKEIKDTFVYSIFASKIVNGDGFRYSTITLGNACEKCFKKLEKTRFN